MKNLLQIFILLVLMFLVSCNNDKLEVNLPDTNKPAVDSAKQADTSGFDMQVHKRVISPSEGDVRIPGPVSVPESEVQVLKKASLGISYHPTMKEGDTKDFTVHVDIAHAEGVLRRIIRQEEKEQNQWSDQSDSSMILTSQVDVYKRLTVKLQYDTADFIITPIDVKDAQDIDFTNGNKWHWTIKAIAHKPVSSIRVVIDAETPDGQLKKISPRKIDIKIQIDARSVLRKAIDFLLNKPEYTIPVILVPLIIFIFKRKKKDEGGKE